MIQLAQRIIITTHVNADPDAISSACVMTEVAKSLNRHAKTRILLPEGVSQESKGIYEICKELGTHITVVKKYSDLEELEQKLNDLCIVVDVASSEQLRLIRDYIKQSCEHILILDHHQYQDLKELYTGSRAVYIGNETHYSSTSEIVFLILEKALNRISPENSKKLVTILLAGVLSDTKRFQRIAANTFHIVAKMIDLGADYQTALRIIAVEKLPSNRIAKIKCILRHRGFRIRIKGKDIYIAVSNVGAFESDCASSLVALGYDIAFVLTEDEKLRAIRLVYRSREDVVMQLGIDIFTEFIKKLVDEFGGGGGGHRAAGGAILRAHDLKGVTAQLIKAMHSISETGIMEFAEERISF
jgi:nanoRNase/pAp phosphatase (c-di-AMP/oligoRNAs hydrolase)